MNRRSLLKAFLVLPNAFEIQTYDSGVAIALNPSGTINDIQTATAKGLVAKGAVSQSANILEIQNSSSTVLQSVDSSGNVNFFAKLVKGKDLLVPGTDPDHIAHDSRIPEKYVEDDYAIMYFEKSEAGFAVLDDRRILDADF